MLSTTQVPTTLLPQRQSYGGETSKAVTSRHHECSLQFIENGNIPRTYHTQKGKEGAQYIWFHVTAGLAQKSKLGFLCKESTRAGGVSRYHGARASGARSHGSRVLLRLAGDTGHLKLPRCFAPERFVPLVTCREAARSPALPREESTCPCLPCPAAQVNGSSRMYCMQKHPRDTAI